MEPIACEKMPSLSLFSRITWKSKNGIGSKKWNEDVRLDDTDSEYDFIRVTYRFW